MDRVYRLGVPDIARPSGRLRIGEAFTGAGGIHTDERRRPGRRRHGGGTGTNVIYTLPPGGGGEYCSTPPAETSDVQGVQASDDSSNVCATVRIQLDQTAVTTRDVFTGGLEIDNGSTTASLTGVEVNLQFVDLAGNPANDKFTILGPDLTGLTAVDGTGIVLPGGTGLAKYTFIPDDDAAVSGPTQYLLEGTLSYIDPTTGTEVVIPLIGSTITVLPDPKSS